MMNVVFCANIILRTHVCMHVCLFDLQMLHCHGDLKQGKYLYWDVLCFGEVWFSSVPVTHCHFPERVPTKYTNTPQPYEPHLFLFSPLVYPPLLACLGSVLIFQHCSVHLLIRSTGSSGNVQMLFSSQLAERVTLHHCVPPWPWNPNTLSHRRHKPSLPAQLARTPSLHQTRSGYRCQVLLQTPASVCSGCKDDGMKFNIPKEPIKFHVLRFTGELKYFKYAFWIFLKGRGWKSHYVFGKSHRAVNSSAYTMCKHTLKKLLNKQGTGIVCLEPLRV